MSWDDFLAEFKKRHAKDYGISGGSVSVNAPSGPTTNGISNKAVYGVLGGVKAPTSNAAPKAPPAPVSAPMAVVLEDEWEPPEVVEVEESENWWDR